jgi:hypothetical protein
VTSLPRLARRSVLTGVLAVSVAACASATSGVADAPTATPPAPASRGGGPVTVPEVLDFTAPKLGGGDIVGADYAGKALAIWFWAPW